MRKIRTNSEEIKIKMFEKNKIKLFDKVKELVFEAVVQRLFCKTGVSRSFAKFTGKRLRQSFLAQVFSCEFCEFFKNTFFYRAPLVAASVVSFQSQIFIKKVSFGIV